MTTPAIRTPTFARAFALVGGVLFVISLAGGFYAYAFEFGRPASGENAVVPIVTNVVLFTAFAFHHSLFARARVKRLVETVVPSYLERSLYVWIASLAFAAVYVFWRPVPGVVWRVPTPASYVFAALQLFGVAMTVLASRKLGVISLAGVRQAFGGVEDRRPDLVESGWYGIVRHPIYLAWVLMVWPAPHMTATRLVFAAASTLYLVIAVPIEERLLRRTFGDTYDRYASRVRWRMVPFLY